MKFISWNVNGLRACLNKGFLYSFNMLNVDIFCVQETKMQIGQVEINTPGYLLFLIVHRKRGILVRAIFIKIEPLSVKLSVKY